MSDRFTMIDVKSSLLVAVGYSKPTRALILEFKRKRIYRYENVPEKVYTDLLDAPSHGKFFHQHIRNEFDCTELTEDDLKQLQRN